MVFLPYKTAYKKNVSLLLGGYLGKRLIRQRHGVIIEARKMSCYAVDLHMSRADPFSVGQYRDREGTESPRVQAVEILTSKKTGCSGVICGMCGRKLLCFTDYTFKFRGAIASKWNCGSTSFGCMEKFNS